MALTMGKLPDYGAKDYSPYTYGTVSVVLLISVFTGWRLDVLALIENTPFQFQSNSFPDILLAIFRTACFALSFYTIIILMVRSKTPGKMNALRHKERDYHLFEILGIDPSGAISLVNTTLSGKYPANDSISVNIASSTMCATYHFL